MRALTPFTFVASTLRLNRRGVAAAEFALIAPLMGMLFLGLFHVGNAVHEMLLLQQALRVGAAYAMSFPTQIGADDSPSTPNNGIVLAIEQALPSTWLPTGPTTPYVTVSPPIPLPCVLPAPCRIIQLSATLNDAWLSTTGLNVVTYVIRVQ